MARAKKTAATPVTVDVVDLITAKLDTMEGIGVTRDAWENKAPDQYGLVVLEEEPIQLRADGHLIDEDYRLSVELYVNGADDGWADRVRTAMEELETEYEWLDIGYRMIARQYLFDIGKVRWAFRLTVPGPLVRTIESGA